MNKYPVVAKTHPVAPKVAARRNRPSPTPRSGELIEAQSPAAGGFLRFSYSYTEVSAAGQTARIKSRRAAYEKGRFFSEQFEGELDRAEYDRMAANAQRYFADHTSLLLRALFPFLP